MRDISQDQDTSKCRINYSIPPIPEDNLRLWLHTSTAPKVSSISMEDDISNYLQSQISNSRLEDVLLHGAQSSNNTNTRNDHEAREQNGCDPVREKCKRQKRPRSTQDHNLSERLRRKKLTEKMTALQEMIPNSVKRDQASTIDDAIKYIKTLQSQVQMMSAEASHTLLHPPVMIVPQLGQRGIQISNLAPPVALATGGNGTCLEMSTLLPSVAYPIGLTNPWLVQSPAIGAGLATTHSIQSNPGQLLEPIYTDDIPCFVSQVSIGANREACPSQDAIRRASRYL